MKIFCLKNKKKCTYDQYNRRCSEKKLFIKQIFYFNLQQTKEKPTDTQKNKLLILYNYVA